MPTKAAIYLRISRDLKGDGLAIDRQRDACQAIITQRGWSTTTEYVDESISAFAKNVKRPGYEQMVADFRAGKFRAIVCYDLDRLTRQPRQLEDWIDASEDHGLQLVTANGEADLTTDGGRMYARIKASVARAESERKGARQQAAAEQRFKLGKVPLGVRLTGYTSHGEVIEDEATVIRDIYARFLRGESLYGIARELNSMGVATRHGGRWGPSSVTDALRNPRYAGHAKYYDQILEGAGTWVPLVSPDDYTLVQTRLDDPARITNRQGTERKYLGGSLFRCGVCKRPVTSFSGQRYRCKDAHSNRTMKVVDDYVIEILTEFFRGDRSKIVAPAVTTATKELAERASAARKELVRYQGDYDAGYIDGPRYKAATDRVNAEIAAADRERASLSHGKAVALILAAADPAQAFLDSTLMEKRAIIAAVIDVYLFPAVRGRKGLDPATVRIVPIRRR